MKEKAFQPTLNNVVSSIPLWSFLLPCLLMLIGFACAGLVPFGPKNLLAMDAYGQYFPMILQRLRTDTAISFEGSLGFSTLPQSAYYTNSPLWWLLKLVPRSYWIMGVQTIVLLRFGLAGLSFSTFTRHYFGRSSWGDLAFSTAYAISGYTLAFINQFMWMDIIVLLPLVALGLVQLQRNGSWTLYVVSLATALLINFYLAYSLCVFAVGWIIYLLLRSQASWRSRILIFVKFTILSVLSAALVSWSLIPAYLGLRQTLASGLMKPKPDALYHPISGYLKQLLPFQKICLAYEEANVYMGLIAILLVVYLLLKKGTQLRDRLLIVGLVVFAFLSFNWNRLDFFWHGFHYPNQLPARQSYLFIFVMLLFAIQAHATLPRLRSQRLGRHLSLPNLVAALLILELFANAIFTLTTYTWRANHTRYTKYDQDMQAITDTYQPDDKDFYRMEFLDPSYNRGLRYGFYGISYYSSLMSARAYQFFKDLGMEVYAKNVSTEYVPNDVLNDVFGVRYLIHNREEPDELEGLDLRHVEDFEHLSVYENPDALPIAFHVDGEEGLHLTAKDLQGFLPNRFTTPVTHLSFDSSSIKGTLRAPTDGLLMTSIGAEDGWTITIDGTPTDSLASFDYLLSTPITAGEHTIELRYQTPGKTLGIIMAWVSFILLVLFRAVDRRKRKCYAESRI